MNYIMKKEPSLEFATGFLQKLSRNPDPSKFKGRSVNREKLPGFVKDSFLTLREGNKILKSLKQEPKDTKSIPKLRPQILNSSPFLNKLNNINTNGNEVPLVIKSESMKELSNRRSTSVAKFMNKIGTTHDVSYMHDFGIKLPKVQLKFEIKPQPSEIQCKLPELKEEKHLDNNEIEQLKEIGKTLSPKADFESIFNKKADERVHLLLKQDIFKNLPFDSFEEGQQKFFANMMTSNRRENLMKEDKGLGVPSSRNDSVILTKWFNAAIQKIFTIIDKGLRINLLRTVYYICFREVVRQISVHCIERGFLVWQLWTAYSELIIGLEERYKSKKKKIVLQNDIKIAKLRGLYENELNIMKEKNKELQNELDGYKKQVDEMQKQVKAHKMKNEELKEEGKIDSDKLLDLNQKYEKLNRLYCEELYAHNSLRSEVESLKTSLFELQTKEVKNVKSMAQTSFDKEQLTIENTNIQIGLPILTFSEPIQINFARNIKLHFKTFRTINIRLGVYNNEYNLESLSNNSIAEYSEDEDVDIEYINEVPNININGRNKSLDKDNKRKVDPNKDLEANKIHKVSLQLGSYKETSINPTKQPLIKHNTDTTGLRLHNKKDNNEIIKPITVSSDKTNFNNHLINVERVKYLEEETFVLKDKLETVNDNIKQIEECNDLVLKLIDDLKSEGNEEKIKEIIKEMQEYYRKIRNELNNVKSYSLLDKKIEELSNKLAFTFKPNSLKYHKNYTRGSKELNEWITKNVNKETRKHIADYENGLSFLILAKTLMNNIEAYPMPKKFLLKVITDTYNHVLNIKEWNLELADYLFGFIMNSYGLQCIAEKKFSRIVAGCLVHSDCKRIQMFARFLGLFKGYTQNDFKQYITMVKEVSST